MSKHLSISKDICNIINKYTLPKINKKEYMNNLSFILTIYRCLSILDKTTTSNSYFDHQREKKKLRQL